MRYENCISEFKGVWHESRVMLDYHASQMRLWQRLSPLYLDRVIYPRQLTRVFNVPT